MDTPELIRAYDDLWRAYANAEAEIARLRMVLVDMHNKTANHLHEAIEEAVADQVRALKQDCRRALRRGGA